MRPRFLYYFIPLFIITYFTLSVAPIVLHTRSEIFPFFSFKLYSHVPNDFKQYDVIVSYGSPDAYYAIRNNSSPNGIERKYYFRTINEVGKAYAEHGTIEWFRLSTLFPSARIAFVRQSGDCLRAVRDGEFETEVIGVYP